MFFGRGVKIAIVFSLVLRADVRAHED
jgi:hypothetical protein